jgi:subtilisin family serine protease
MRRVVLLTCALGLLWPAAAPAQPTGRLLVSMRPGQATAALAGVQATGRGVPAIGLRVVRPGPGERLRAAQRRLRRDPAVRAVDVEHQAHPRAVPNDPAINAADPASQAHGETLQWWAVREHFPEAWALADGDSVAVAVIDQGVDVTHPDLAPKIRRTLDFDRRRDDGGPNVDRNGHGTHVASLACAQPDNAIGLAGAGYGCGLIVVKSDLSDSSLVRSIVGATKAGASVITMSLGTDDRRNAPRSIRDAVDYAYDRGVVLVAAAADRQTTEQGDPANILQPTGTGRLMGVGKGLSVTAADFRGGRARWAGDGSQISLAAYGAFHRAGPDGLLGAFPATSARPRLEIGVPASRPCACRTLLGGDDRYAFLEGTSMATPIVAGAAALVRDLNPDLGPADVIRTLKRSAQRRAGSGWSVDVGWGLVDAAAAVRLAARLDRRPPASQLSIPAPPSGDEVEVVVAADDELGPVGVRVAGLRTVRIYAAADGGTPEAVGELSAAGTARIRLDAGHSYALYSVAVDRAGNEEAPPPKPDATVAL